jgi:hypothetical protein
VRFALFDDEVDGAHDLDLYVFQGAALAGQSGGTTSNEVVTFTLGGGAGFPVPIALTVVVHGFNTAAASANFKLFQFNVANAAAGNMVVTEPADAIANTTAPIHLTFPGLAAGTRYFGHVQHRNGTTALPSTFVSVKTP